MRVVILKNSAEVSVYGAQILIKHISAKPSAVLGLATGSTPIALYRELIAANHRGDVSFRQVSSFNLDEYWGSSGEHSQSYRHFMNQVLFDHIDIDKANTAVPAGDAVNPWDACAAYEAAIIDKGGIDIQLLGIGRNGHIGFNEPFSSLRSRTRIKTLTRATISDNARFFGPGEFQPHLSLTMGIGTILDARKIVLLATGESKAEAILATVEGPVSASCPASALQLHKDVVLIIDEAAAHRLSDADFFKHIEAENQKLISRYTSI